MTLPRLRTHGIMEYNIPTCYGMGGGPLISFDEKGNMRIEAINRGKTETGNPELNYGRALTAEVLKELRRQA